MKVAHLFAIGGLLFIMAGLALAVDAQEAGPVTGVGEPPSFLQGYYEAWVNSPHAAVEDEAFVHWDAEGEVPDTCAKCHSSPGYQDFLGVDGSEYGVVDAPAPIGTVVNCDTCHNPVASNLASVTFPSGAEVDENLDDSGRCMVCHQGRASGQSVDNAIEGAGLSDDLNAPSEDLRFINIHYYAAAASLFGSEVNGGYEFEGQRYQPRFDHVASYDTCAECHSPHTLEVQVEACESCHEDVEEVEDLRDIRMLGSLVDYDGDGDIEEGIAGEIETLQETLMLYMQAYAANVIGTPIAYDEHAYPYFFIDGNENGVVDEEEATSDNGYVAFSGRLLQAAYNYQVSIKDPGNYAHNAKYHIQLLYDSIQALNQELGGEEGPVDVALLNRNDPGHFDATAEAFRHWDEDGEVPAGCVKCHTEGGLPFLMTFGTTINSEPSDSLGCITCHDDIGEFSIYEIEEVVFPSGAELSFDDEESNLCINCHQGRESTVSVDAAIAAAGVGPDEVSEALRFRNPHYFAAGATLFGGEAMGAYQFEDKEYVERFEHEFPVVACIDCHDQHQLEIRADVCSDCHDNVETPEDVLLIRQEGEDEEPLDYDGDGDVTEPIRAEIEALHNDLYTYIQQYAIEVIGTPIVYAPHDYPYWYVDANSNGVLEDDELVEEGMWSQWTPQLLRAAYNYQYVAKDPGAFAHNADYILQVLYDSIEAMGGEEAVANYTRPPEDAND